MRYLTKGGGPRSRDPSFLLLYISILRENRSYMRTRQTAREKQKKPGTVTKDTHVSPSDSIPFYDFETAYHARGSYLSSYFSAPTHHP
ncbi:hypothetical protein RSOLAG1IB_06990 [Rhizoctonia solani AG-1 IB]|uniref:Uncharacterized protein n=1 Tax=Thanatephorus cucumeris (strain AG1-IB / isolate 7/3/14) TaxID=1108050 RepID=A0A0B7F9W4_THACB|nr:hypothetical protein RSOLAG1IB_06990 [Rhizoctonia solani AG-1 IB]